MKIKVGFFAVLLFCALLLTHSFFALASLLAMLLHELGHLLAAFICRIRMRELSLGLFGAGLVPSDGLYSYCKEIVLCLGGPLANLLSASFALPLLRALPYEFLEAFVFSSFAYAILNLLPIKDFDGGRIFRALLLSFFSIRIQIVEKLLSVVSFLFVFSLWTLSVYLLMRAAISLSLFIFSLSLFSRLFLSEE